MDKKFNFQFLFLSFHTILTSRLFYNSDNEYFITI